MNRINSVKNKDITGIIMAGGRGQRMGNKDKGLLLLDGIPLFEHVAMRIQDQVSTLVINANRHQKDYARLGYPVINDDVPGFLGPLAAIHAALIGVKTDWCLFVSCDTPFLPLDLVTFLVAARGEKKAVCVHDGTRLHPIPLLLHRKTQTEIETCLSTGRLKVRRFLEDIGFNIAFIPNQHLDFININTLDELLRWNEKSRSAL